MRRRPRSYAAAMLLAGAVALVCTAALAGADQFAVETRDVETGDFLVASRDLRDPNFMQTVVLLFQRDAKATAGVIVNRQTDTPLSAVLKEMKSAEGRRDVVYQGGPVSPGSVFALLESKRPVEGAKSIFENVHALGSKSALERILAEGVEGRRLRVYLGYAGWSRGQLEREIAAEAWHVVAGDARAVFDPDPDAVWPRLIGRTGLRLALWMQPKAQLKPGGKL